MPKLLQLPQAVREIKVTVKAHSRAFFFMTGAGVSHPAIPLACQIAAECEAIAKKQETWQMPTEKGQAPAYAWYLQQAYPSPQDRKDYFEGLVKKAYVTKAIFRLSHLLIEPSVTNLVVTANFDDLLSKALNLFGVQHVICDHSETTQRIELDSEQVQIVHIHGSHRFYDLCNLPGELGARASLPPDSTSSMGHFLDSLLRERSPLVTGYSGWEDDVFMTALKRRLKTALGYNVYWFCYRREDVDALPGWLTDADAVYLVVPPEAPERTRAMEMTGERSEAYRLSAQRVFDEMNRVFAPKEPELTLDPLSFFVKHLRNSLPPVDPSDSDDVYGVRRTIQTVEDAMQQKGRSVDTDPLLALRTFVRGSKYREAADAAAKVVQEGLTPDQLRELCELAWQAGTGLFDNSDQEMRAYDTVIDAGSQLSDLETQSLVAKALVNKGATLGRLGKDEEEIAAYEQVVERFGQATEVALHEQVAAALVNKSVRLGQLGKNKEAIAMCEEVMERFGETSGIALREQVAKALLGNGNRLCESGTNEEAIPVYDQVVERFGEATEAALRELVAKALFNKGVTLGQMGKREEAIAVYEQVVERFGEATEAALREPVAIALINKGVTLGQLGKNEEAIAVYEQVVGRYGEATEAVFRVQVAKALVNKAFRLGQLGKSEEAIAVLTTLVSQFEQDTHPPIQNLVSIARSILTDLHPPQPDQPTNPSHEHEASPRVSPQ